jgi:hypothetical protein
VFLFFRYDGSNPLNMSHNDLNSQVVGSVTVNLFFTSKGKADGRIYRADEILQYNEESIREM